MERTAALRDLKLLIGSGSLDFAKGMHSLDKRVEQISFQQCVTFREHGQLKGWQPHFQPTVAKSSISTHCNSRHGKWTNKTHDCNIPSQTLENSTLTRPMLLCMSHKSGVCNKGMGSFASIMQPQCRAGGTYCGSQEPASGREWMLGIPKRNGVNGLLKQTCRTKLFSAVSHILRTWAAERLAATLPTDCS